MSCFKCEYHTPNGECYIGTIENCPLEKIIKEIKEVCDQFGATLGCSKEFLEVHTSGEKEENDN